MSKRNGHTFIPLQFASLPVEEQRARAQEFASRMQTRRTVRQFSSRAVPRDLIEGALRVASRAPSGGQSAAVAICGGVRWRNQAEDPAGSGSGREGELRTEIPPRVAGCLGGARDGLA